MPFLPFSSSSLYFILSNWVIPNQLANRGEDKSSRLSLRPEDFINLQRGRSALPLRHSAEHVLRSSAACGRLKSSCGFGTVCWAERAARQSCKLTRHYNNIHFIPCLSATVWLWRELRKSCARVKRQADCVCVCVCVCVLLFPVLLLTAEQSSLTHWFLSSWQALLTPRSSCLPRPLLLTSPPLSLSLSLSLFLAELKSWIVGQQILAQSEPD